MAIQDNYLSGTDDYRKALALAMLRQGIDTSPVQHWTQGAARIAQALMGGIVGNQLQQEQMQAMQYDPMGAIPGRSPAAEASPMGNRIAEALSQPSVTPPVMPVEGGGTVPTPPPRPIMNRSAYTDAANDPSMAQRLATIIQGEVGRGATPAQQQVQLETILNRATARGQSLGDVTQMYTGPGSRGYYPQSTFTNGSATPEQTATFKQNILTPVLRGSDTSTAALGFPATGNASGGVAANGINNGRYTQYANLGPETYVQEGKTGPENIDRLNATRLAQAGPADIPQNAQPTAQAGQAPTQQAPTQLPQGMTPEYINRLEAGVNATLADPNAPLAVKQKAYSYKQWILQHRMEQAMKYGPEAIAGEAAKAAAVKSGQQSAEFSPAGIAGAARLKGAQKEAELPSEVVLKGSPSFEDKQKLEQKTQAQGTLTNTVGQMADAYVTLDKMGKVISPDRGAVENLKTAFATTDAGQKALMATGDQAASIRQQIKNSEPALINAIRQATNMGARGLDSNVELSFYMQQVGNPSRDVYSNLAALDRLDKAYGLGVGVKERVSKEMYEKIQSASAQLHKDFSASSRSAPQSGGIIKYDAQGNRIQ